MSIKPWHDLEQIPYWVKYRGIIPENAVKGGYQDGEKLYVGRAVHMGSITPGKILQSQKSCYIPWGFQEHVKTNFEILVGAEGCWVSLKDYSIPISAFPAGYSEQGDILYIGRAKHENSLIVGKVHKRYNLCYLPYKGKEIEISECEILLA